ncbi:MAG: MOSC domain-containing protein [Cellulosilyticaceae bacterium]
MGKIMAICISEKKGTQKQNIRTCELVREHGLKNDAHAGNWHRQVSLLAFEKIEDFKARGAQVRDGDFGENIIVSGIDLVNLPVGTLLRSGDILLEVTQIGKECHQHCQIYQKMGECIMPKQGIFARVLEGGILSEGDVLSIVEA